MPTDWSRMTNTTINDYIREVEPNVDRNRKLLSLMMSRGLVTFNHEGLMMDWKVEYKRAPMQGYADNDTLTFSKKDRFKTAQLEWRGYAATDSMTEIETLKNKGQAAIIKYYDDIARFLLADMKSHLGDELYKDGNAAGNEKIIHGINSLFGTSGANASAPIGTPSDTYAGLSTVLGNYGGSALTGNWPTGTFDEHYDFWSPLIVDYTSAVATASGGWAATTKTWPNTCEEALRYGLIKTRKNRNSGMVDLILLNDELYRQFLDKVSPKERLNIRKGDKPGSLYALGFEDTFNFDGCEVSYEYGVPATEGYGFPLDKMELKSLADKLFNAKGPDYDIASQSYRFAISMYGNLQFESIRSALKFDNVS